MLPEEVYPKHDKVQKRGLTAAARTAQRNHPGSGNPIVTPSTALTSFPRSGSASPAFDFDDVPSFCFTVRYYSLRNTSAV